MADVNLTIRVSEEFRKEIKIKLAKEGINLKEYLTRLIEEDLKKDTK